MYIDAYLENKMVVEEKEEVKESLEKKEEKVEKEWWKSIPNWMLVVGAFILFIAMRGVTMEKGGMSQVLILMAVVAVLVIMSKKYKEVEGVLTPKEAEILVEREWERKKAWNQFNMMDKFAPSPVNNAQHRDGRGMYYDTGFKVINPYSKATYYIGKVTMKGPERGYVSFIESIGPLTGREKPPERTILPISRKLMEHPLVEKMLGFKK